ncbi:hypothetical protein ACFQZU_18095, partial [Streptomonospora algeriensis]
DLFELVDKERIETILNQDPVSRPQQVWHLYSMAVLLSDEWLTPAPAAGESPERVRIPIR